MRAAQKRVVLLVVLSFFVWASAVDQVAAANSTSTADECKDDFQNVMVCLDFAQGKVATPTKQCCSTVSSIKESKPKCLCFIIQQTASGGQTLKSMGVQESKLLQLPSACGLKNASISDCPKLLGLSPSSPDAAIFTNTSSAAPTTTSGTSSASEKSDDASGTSHGLRPIVPALLFAMATYFYAVPGGSASLF